MGQALLYKLYKGHVSELICLSRKNEDKYKKKKSKINDTVFIPYCRRISNFSSAERPAKSWAHNFNPSTQANVPRNKKNVFLDVHETYPVR